MKIVLDNNIFFSLMNPNSVASYVFSMHGFEFYAPDHMISELDEHEDECVTKSRLSKHEFEIRRKEVEQRIKFINLSEYKPFFKKAISSISDEDDAPYLALALMLNAVIWSNDSHMKEQKSVKAYLTEELINGLLEDKF